MVQAAPCVKAHTPLESKGKGISLGSGVVITSAESLTSERISLLYGNSPNEPDLKGPSVGSCLTEQGCEIADFILGILVLWVTHRKKGISQFLINTYQPVKEKKKGFFDTAMNYNSLN